MSNIVKKNEFELWEKEDVISQIKDIYGKTLTNVEWETFLGIGRATGLNPFLREIWAVKYRDSPAQIFVGRDGYRKGAQQNPDYDCHIVDAVYSGDKFVVSNGMPLHEYQLTDRGNLLGAYALVYRKSSSNPFYVFVSMKEYRKPSSSGKPTTWDIMPSTMIKKVAEAQALRMAFQEKFAGTYSEFEQDHVLDYGNKEEIRAPLNKKENLLKKFDKVMETPIEGEIEDPFDYLEEEAIYDKKES